MRQNQSCSMSPSDGSSSDPEPPPHARSSGGGAVALNLNQEGMVYLQVSQLSEQLAQRDRLINSLETEIKLLQSQITTKNSEVLAAVKEKELLRKQLIDARLRISHLEKAEAAKSLQCNTENCSHLKELESLNLNAETETIDTQLKHSELLAEDLHKKLGEVFSSMKTIAMSLAKLGSKQVEPETSILGLPDNAPINCVEANDIKVETEVVVPKDLVRIIGVNHDASSSSSTDVRDSLEVVLQSLPANISLSPATLPALPEIEFVKEIADAGMVELKCAVCNLNFKFTKEQAALATEENQTFKCEVCQKGEQEKSLVIFNESPQKSNKIFKCTICNKVFNFPSKLKNHLRTHTGEKPFHCNVCGKSFSLSFNLKIHYRTHSGERPFACGVCGKNFRQSKSLLYHNCSHNLRKKAYDLGNHQIMSSEDKHTYFCKICSKNFQSQSLLRAHELTHRGKETFSCDACGEAFSFPKDLKSHWCPRTFKQTEAQSNSNVQSDLQLFKCIVCSESFTESSQLMKHQWTHQTETPPNMSFVSPHGSKRFPLALPSSSDSSGGATTKIGSQQVPELFPAKDLNGRLKADLRREGKSDGLHHRQPEFYDISELAMLKSYAD